jgi:hypothetical protein
MSGNFIPAVEKLNQYIEKFPTGNFILNAHYYKADCNYRAKEYAAALESYSYVLKKSKSKFTEYALLNSARINYENGNYPEAMANYIELEKVAEIKTNLVEAVDGKMKSAYYSNNFNDALTFAKQLLATEKLTDENYRMAHFILAKSFDNLNQKDAAFEEYELLSQDCKNVQGAEAYYRIIEILFSKKEYEKAEKEIFIFVEKNTPHQYWLAKSFLTLADIYMIRKDNFQAKHTLQSIIDNYKKTNDELNNAAQAKLEQILENEKAEQQLKEVLEIQLKFEDNTDGKYDKLFNEDREEKSIIENNVINEPIQQ